FDVEWFDRRNPDLHAAGVDPLVHFHRYGWREHRLPNAYFDTGWYLRYNRDVASAGLDPLLHYYEYGEAEGRRPIEHFEPEWYRARYGVPDGECCLAHFLRHRLAGWVSPVPEFDPVHYLSQSPDVADAGMDPFEHYLVIGAAEGREPSTALDVRYYRARYLAALPHANPLVHYRRHRHEPGIYATQSAEQASLPQQIRLNTQPGPLFETYAPREKAAPLKAKLLAFYLPQFHPVPENDRWWGTGFTEWTNVARGVPRFVGHYQPRIPRDLGHYRLQGTSVLADQIAMAQGAGIHGFIFYFYWFNGKRLLESPLEAFLADRKLDMPFCLMWANENWTRRWDGSEQEVLLSQDYRDEDEPALVETFARHFDDPRYIRLEGRPVLMVYRAGLIPGGAASVERWRRRFAAVGHAPLFIMAQSFGERDPRDYGMDAAVEFPPHKITEHLPQLNGSLRMLDFAADARVFDYDVVASASDLTRQPYPLIRTALPGWDNDARRQGRGMTIHGATPAAYQAWLARLIDTAACQKVGGEALVCINAWNEWAEGAYLEPDVHFGAAFLNATARAVSETVGRSPGQRLLLVGHDAFTAGSQLLLLHIGRAMVQRGVAVSFLLLGGGPLETDYRSVAPTTLFAGADELARYAASLAASGYRSAIVNTSASGHACAALAKSGIACTLLLHEMPRLLRERQLIAAGSAGVAAARHTVFAAAFVRDRYHELIALAPERTVLLPQGLYRPVERTGAAERRARLRLPEGATFAVGLGYADLRKGFDLFLQVWRLAHAADPSIHLLWVGDLDPVISAYLGAEMAAAAATGTFHRLPFQADGAEWLAAADVHLLTSREDPYPSVVLEAMSAGVPTIAFEDVGGVPDLLREHGAGTAVPLGDGAAMVRQLRVAALQTGPEQRARLARVARQRFPFAAYVDALLDLAAPARPAVSVMVPTLDYAAHLPARLHSVFAQTVPPLEIVVLDDGSSDGSEAVVQGVAREAGSTVEWVKAEGSVGLLGQWRRVAHRARGEFVWIAEADDLAEPGLLEQLCGALRAAPGAAFAFADSRAIDAAGSTLWSDHQAYYRESGTTLLAQSGAIGADAFLRECLGARNLVLNASAVVWRRDALRGALARAGERAASFRLALDWRLYAEAVATGGSVAYVAAPLNSHRRHPGGITARTDTAGHLDEIRRMHRFINGIVGPDRALASRQRKAIAAAKRELAAAPT
ncbi:MAG: glycoside hydrolase family 99-like domain-containing protein, partial [Acetobacteraceae bacterium]|nr:glycoside hydrolase family 99-like domain-containing protein [Acetobacteraceae bacterium]